MIATVRPNLVRMAFFFFFFKKTFQELQLREHVFRARPLTHQTKDGQVEEELLVYAVALSSAPLSTQDLTSHQWGARDER